MRALRLVGLITVVVLLVVLGTFIKGLWHPVVEGKLVCIEYHMPVCMPGYHMERALSPGSCPRRPQCIRDAKPSAAKGGVTIRLLMPNGGEKYHIGDAVSVAQEGGHKGIETTMSWALVDQFGTTKEVDGMSFTDGKFTWKIDSYRDKSSIEPGTYKLRVSSGVGGCPTYACVQMVSDDSDEPFVIVR